MVLQQVPWTDRIHVTHIKRGDLPKVTESSEELLNKLGLEQWSLKKLIDIPDYFYIFETTPGKKAAFLQGRLLERWNALHVKRSDEAAKLLQAFNHMHLHYLKYHMIMELCKTEQNSSPEPECTKEIFHLLYQAICPLLYKIIYPEKDSKELSLKKLKKAFNLACERWAARNASPMKHGRTKQFKSVSKADQRILPIAAIEHAKNFCLEQLRLPFKSELKARLEQDYSQTIEWKSPRWAKLWRDAGLNDLPSAEPWQFSQQPSIDACVID